MNVGQLETCRELSYNHNPQSVIGPFNVIFYNCLQYFACYKVSFACF